MSAIKKSKKNMPDLTEYTDNEGHKWIQTSLDDLLSVNEFNDILDKIQKDREKDEIILARFDFQKVNKEYYETILDLKARLKNRNETLKKILIDARDKIDKKNKKLKELIKYIRSLHLLLAYHKTKPDDIEKLIPSPDAVVYEQRIEAKEKAETREEYIETKEKIVEYTEVKEILLDENGQEKGAI